LPLQIVLQYFRSLIGYDHILPVSSFAEVRRGTVKGTQVRASPELSFNVVAVFELEGIILMALCRRVGEKSRIEQVRARLLLELDTHRLSAA
jgi:hypothetical protein